MNDVLFNGVHLAAALVIAVVAFAFGAIYGWLLRDERDDLTKPNKKEN